MSKSLFIFFCSMLCMTTGLSALAQTASIFIKASSMPVDSVFATIFRDRIARGVNEKNMRFTKQGGGYLLHIPGLQKPGYMEITTEPGRIPFHGKPFIIEPGDSIIIRENGSLLSITGNGSAKYQYLYAADTLKNGMINRFDHVANTKAMIDADIGVLLAGYIRGDSIYHTRQRLLDRYSHNMAPSVNEMIRTDLYADNKLSMLLKCVLAWSWCFEYPDSLKRMNIVKQFFEEHVLPDTLTGNWASKALSYPYQRYLVNVTTWNDAFQHRKMRTDCTPAQYTMLREKYKHAPTAFREKLLTAFLILEARQNATMLGEIERLAASMESSEYRVILQRMAEIRSHNRPAFAFSFPDSEGNIRELSDFKGKVLLLDFWFTGCGACRLLTKHLAPVYERYKSNPGVAFISINIDNEINAWKKSSPPKNGYVDPSSINLYAQGNKNGSNEIMEYYGLTSCPQLVLIDKEGKVVTTRAKRAPANVSVRDHVTNLITRELEKEVR